MIPVNLWTIIHTRTCTAAPRSINQAIPVWRKRDIAEDYRRYLCQKRECKIVLYTQLDVIQ